MSALIEKLKEVTKDMLSEESLNQISEAFEQQVTKAAEDRAKLQIDALLVKIDEDHSSKVEKLVEAIDRNHSEKLLKVVEAINENHAGKLKAVVRKYEKALNEDAATFKQSLVESISNYLEAYLDENLPNTAIEEAVNNKRANQVLNELRSMLSVDLILGKETIREAVMDGKSKLDESSRIIDELKKQNSQLNESLTKVKSDLVLEQRTAGLPDSKKTYLSKVFKGKSAEFIKENFDYTVKMFEKQESKNIETLTEQAINNSVTKNLDRPVIEESQEVIEEGSENADAAHPPLRMYMQELSRH
jgi:hypothetical protein